MVLTETQIVTEVRKRIQTIPVLSELHLLNLLIIASVFIRALENFLTISELEKDTSPLIYSYC